MTSLSYARLQARRDKHRLMLALRAEANRLEREAALDKPDTLDAVAVTDHAVIRFLERVMKLDVEGIRGQIARLVPPSAMPSPSPADPDPNGILIVNGFQFLLSPSTVVSVLDESMSAAAWVGLPNRADFVSEPRQ